MLVFRRQARDSTTREEAMTHMHLGAGAGPYRPVRERWTEVERMGDPLHPAARPDVEGFPCPRDVPPGR